MAAQLMQGCKDPPPAPPPPYASSVQLTLDDTGVTEAWLRLKFTDASLPRTFSLERAGHTTLSGTLVGQDTLLVDTGMAPGASYTYKALRLIGTARTDSSTPLQITTMDTPSHAISWELDTLGDAYSGLNDIAIVNDTLAYAVGEMYLRDSTGQFDPGRYNAAIWNGSGWSIRRFPYYYGGNPYINPIEGVYAFDVNDIWFVGNGVIRWTGTGYITMPVPSSVWGNDRMDKIWGTSGDQLYIVGTNGSIAHFNAGTWQRVESGASLDFHDIWGSRNGSGQWEILAIASTSTPETQGCAIVRIDGNSSTAVSTSGLVVDIFSASFIPGRKYYIVGAGVFHKRLLSDPAWVEYPYGTVTYHGSSRVRGNSMNDVFVVGSFGEVVHFNGVSWHSYFERYHLPNGAYSSLAVSDHLVIAVGDIGAYRGIALIGRR